MRWRTLAAAVTAAATAAAVLVVGAPPAAAVDVAGGAYFPVQPARVLDTRLAADGPCVAPASPRFVTVAGLGGVPEDAPSVVLNVTVTRPTTGGFLTVYPAGEERPTVSSLNFAAGATVPNAVTVKVGVAGQVALFVSSGCAHVLVDVVGFHTPGATAAGGFVPLSPQRLLDTRAPGQGPCVAGGTVRELVVTGGTVPADAAAVTLNVTVAAPTAAGFLTVFPAGSPRPTVSTLNFVAGDVRANAATVRVGAGGRVALFVDAGCARVLVDVVGFTSGGTAAPGGYRPVAPRRLLDTRRTGQGPCVAGGTTRVLTVVGADVPGGARSVTLNVTAVAPTSAGFATVFPAGAARPLASSLNFDRGQVVANAVTVRVGNGGQVELFVNAGCAHLLVDVVGSTSAPAPLTVVRTDAGPGPFVDGPRGTAAFLAPTSVALERDGSAVVLDVDLAVLRRVSPTGRVSTLAGRAGVEGGADGPGAAARFRFAEAVAVGPDGTIFVAESQQVRRVTPAGVVSPFVGGAFGSVDGQGAAARFRSISDLDVDRNGNLYVTDQAAKTVRKVSPAGVVTTLAGLDGAPEVAVDGSGSAARFVGPSAVAVGDDGVVHVADDNTLRTVSPVGVVTTVAGTAGANGRVDGTGAAARFGTVLGLDVAPDGSVLAAENEGVLRRVLPGGVVTTVAGERVDLLSSADGTGPSARFSGAKDVAVRLDGSALVADFASFFGRLAFGQPLLSGVRTVSPTGVVTTLTGVLNTVGVTDGPGRTARFDLPASAAADAAGNLYVADRDARRIRKVTVDGVVTTFAGTGAAGSDDGPGATATFRDPSAVAVDTAGNVYVGDFSLIRKITPAGVVSTIAGQVNLGGSVDGDRATATLSTAVGMTVTSGGDIYITQNSGSSKVRRVTQTGSVTTIAGPPAFTPGASVDGVGAAVRFVSVAGVVADNVGNLFVADRGASTIRKVQLSSGTVTTVAGTALTPGSVDGTGAAARFSSPQGLGFDPATRQLFVTDARNSDLRVMDTQTGVVTRVAGGVARGEALDDGTAARATFGAPAAVGLRPDGSLWVLDGESIDSTIATPSVRRVVTLR